MNWRVFAKTRGNRLCRRSGIYERIHRESPRTDPTTMGAPPVDTPRGILPGAVNLGKRRRRLTRRLPALLVSVLTICGCSRLPPAGDDAFDAPSPRACRQVVPADAIVRWVEAQAPRDREALARWCDTIGPVLLQPLAAVSSVPIADRLAVLTWNVHVGSGNVKEVVRRLRAGEFTGGEPVDHFVLLLQEAYRRDTAIPAQIPRGFPAPSRIAARIGRGPDIRHTATELGLALFYVPAMRNGITSVDPEDRGNAILSTLDLRDPVVVELPMGKQRRTAVVATVRAQGRDGSPWEIRIANVHLDTTLALTRGGPFAARRRQAHALIESLRTAEDVPTVLAGDFNTWWGPNEPALNILRSAFPETPRTKNAETWKGPLGIRAQLDYMFMRGRLTGTRVQRLPSRFGSDHYPLVAIVSAAPPRGSAQ
jgi:endonuclease/exonuclease/phosphatase family metal-dependent hydrolase